MRRSKVPVAWHAVSWLWGVFAAVTMRASFSGAAVLHWAKAPRPTSTAALPTAKNRIVLWYAPGEAAKVWRDAGPPAGARLRAGEATRSIVGGRAIVGRAIVRDRQWCAIVNGAQSSMVRNRQSCAIVAARAQWTARRTTTMAIWDGPPLRVAPPFFY
jgi:hypothetical protein